MHGDVGNSQRLSPPCRGTPAPSYALLGLGAVGLGVSTWLVISGRSDAADSEALCPATRCGNRAALEANDRARTKGTWGLATGVLGLASVGVGGYLVFRRAGTDVAIAPAAGASDFGVTARARW